MILNTIQPSGFLHDTGWQEIDLSDISSPYPILDKTDDLTNAFKIDISALNFTPRLVFFAPKSTPAQGKANSNNTDTHYALTFCFSYLNSQGVRGDQTLDNAGTGILLTPSRDNNNEIIDRWTIQTAGNGSLWPMIIDNKNQLVLCANKINTTLQNTYLYPAIYRWRILG